jgi:hypothetical protein
MLVVPLAVGALEALGQQMLAVAVEATVLMVRLLLRLVEQVLVVQVQHLQ